MNMGGIEPTGTSRFLEDTERSLKMSTEDCSTTELHILVAVRGIEPLRGISTKSPHGSDLTPISQFCSP